MALVLAASTMAAAGCCRATSASGMQMATRWSPDEDVLRAVGEHIDSAFATDSVVLHPQIWCNYPGCGRGDSDVWDAGALTVLKAALRAEVHAGTGYEAYAAGALMVNVGRPRYRLSGNRVLAEVPARYWEARDIRLMKLTVAVDWNRWAVRSSQQVGGT